MTLELGFGCDAALLIPAQELDSEPCCGYSNYMMIGMIDRSNLPQLPLLISCLYLGPVRHCHKR